MEYEKVKRFFSRKNNTWLVTAGEREYVLKEYVMGDPGKEWEILVKCHKEGVKAPEPIGIDERGLLMEYLRGEPLSDRGSLSDMQCVGLARWMHSFHTALPGMKRGDPMLRNFVEHYGVIYGMDFEEAEEGDPLEDVSMLCASILSEDPIFERSKRDCVMLILREYSRLLGRDVEERCIGLIRSDLFKIYDRWINYRGKREDLLIQWASFCKTVL